jgi:hypothetical protein
MRKINILLLLVTLVVAIVNPSVASHFQNPTHARTENGREVLLYPDGTWKYAENASLASAPPGTFNKSSNATKAISSQKGAFRIWIDEAKWKQVPNRNEDAEFQFTLVSGEAYAMAITERLPIPINSLKEIALSNAKIVAPDIHVVLDEERVVNGHKILCLIMEGKIKEIPFVYYGYYYSDKTGTIQLITYTGQALFEEYKEELTNFLNGLEVYQK